MSDVGEVAGAVTSITDLIGGILSRQDRDGPDKEFNENIRTLQEAFANNQLDSDNFRLFLDRLFIQSGAPLTPTSDPGVGRRELLHALLLNTISLIKERRYTARYVAAITGQKRD